MQESFEITVFVHKTQRADLHVLVEDSCALSSRQARTVLLWRYESSCTKHKGLTHVFLLTALVYTSREIPRLQKSFKIIVFVYKKNQKLTCMFFLKGPSALSSRDKALH